MMRLNQANILSLTCETVSATTFTGALSGNASSATKLQNSRNFRTNLGSTSTSSFNGTADCSPGVTGTLGFGNGGTGQTTRANALSALTAISEGSEWKTAPTGLSLWKYEQSNTTDLDVPHQNCFIVVLKTNKGRGTALALGWASGECKMWRNTLHDDTQSNKWTGWKTPSVLTNLGSTTAADIFSATPRPGVTGTLPAGNGGTGQTSLSAAGSAILNALSTGTSTPSDADYYICQYAGGGTTTTTYHRRPISALWTYIQNKISSILGMTSTAYGGNTASATKLATARTLTIGSTGKSFNGTANVSWSLTEIGAAAISHTHNYLPLAGGTLTGLLTIAHATNATMTTATTNPRIVFSENGSQPVGLVYTDYDTYRSPFGLKVMSMTANAGSAWFEVEGNIIAGGTITGTKVYNATWNDYAEYFERGEDTEVGDIIALNTECDEEKYVKATEDSIVAGVHSNTYGHIIGGNDVPEGYKGTFETYNEKSFIPIGIKGRVYCKVVGKIKKGDEIYSSEIAGVGKARNGNYKSLVGYACESYDSTEIGLIKVLLK